MNVAVESEVRWQGWRAVPWSVWLFLALAVLYAVVRTLDTQSFLPLQTVAGLAPFLFAAAVAYARPWTAVFSGPPGVSPPTSHCP